MCARRQLKQAHDKIDSLEVQLATQRAESDERLKEHQRQREELIEARVRLESTSQQLTSTREQLLETESRINSLLALNKQHQQHQRLLGAAGDGSGLSASSFSGDSDVDVQQQLELSQAQINNLRDELAAEKEHVDHYRVRAKQQQQQHDGGDAAIDSHKLDACE